MPSEQGERLREFLAVKDMTQAALARRLGVSPAYVNDVITGRKNVTLNFANRLSREVGLSPYWLIWGAGPMEAEEANERLGEADPSRRVATGEGLAAEDEPAWGRTGCVPIAGVLSPGEEVGDVVAERLQPQESCPMAPGCHGWRVRGDALHPVAQDGQVALLAEGEPADGSLALLTLADGRSLFRRVREAGENLVLESVHPEQPAEPLTVARGDVRTALCYRGTLG